MTTLSAAVGIRNGTKPMPNAKGDLDKITALFDRIPVSRGGSAEIGGLWASDRDALIAEVTAQIIAFQTANGRPVIDGVIDPGGGTLKLMDAIAGHGPVTVSIEKSDVSAERWAVVQPNSMQGTGKLVPQWIGPPLIRRLIKVENCSIKWFGVAVPDGSFGSTPHIFFTPAPWQGGHQDPVYDRLGDWVDLWDKYTSIMGSQIAASGADQILVLPMYKNSQHGNLGDFLANWKEVVGAVITATINDIDPYYLRDTYTFDSIVTSSFSNGYVPHQQFFGSASNAADMTTILFDMDGQAGGSHWRPTKGVIYLNTQPPRDNPRGQHWYVGGRWSGTDFHTIYKNTSDHNRCPFLLYHGLSTYC